MVQHQSNSQRNFPCKDSLPAAYSDAPVLSQAVERGLEMETTDVFKVPVTSVSAHTGRRPIEHADAINAAQTPKRTCRCRQARAL